MRTFNMDNDLYVQDLRTGTGSTKWFDYFVNGIRIKTKTDVYKAIKLKIKNIVRKDKIGNKIERFNHKTLSFEREERR